MLDLFPYALVGAAVQGWLRAWDDKGSSSQRSLPFDLSLLRRYTVIASDAVLGHDAEEIERWAGVIDLLAITLGAAGADVFHEGRRIHVPAMPVQARDSTGAGDVFAAVLLLAVAGGYSPAVAAGHANRAAAHFVQYRHWTFPRFPVTLDPARRPRS